MKMTRDIAVSVLKAIEASKAQSPDAVLDVVRNSVPVEHRQVVLDSTIADWADVLTFADVMELLVNN